MLAGAIGLLVMFGWALDISWIKSGLPHTVRMRPAAASALVLAASSLFIVASDVHRKLKRLATLLASAVVLLGWFPLGRYALVWWGGSTPTSGVDLGGSYLASSPSMSPLGALSVAAIGMALITLSLGRFKPFTRAMATLAAVIGMAVVLRYVWAGDELVFGGFPTPMGVHAALAVVLIGAGTWFVGDASADAPSATALARASIEFKVAAGFCIAFLLLVFGGGITYRAGSKSAESAESVADVQGVRTQVWQLYAEVAEAEAVALSYLLTGDPLRKEDFFRHAEAARRHALALGAVVGYDTSSQDVLVKLIELEAQRLGALKEAMASYDTVGRYAPPSPEAVEEAKQVLASIRALALDIDDDQDGMLLNDQARARESQQNALRFLLLTLLGVTATFVLLAHSIRREMLARALADEGVRKLNAQLERRVSERTADLEINRRRVTDLFEFANSALVIADGTGVIQQANRQTEDLFGWTRAELLGQPLTWLVPVDPGSRDAWSTQSFLEVLSSGVMSSGHDKLKAVRKDGSSFSAELTLSPIHTGGALIVLVSIRDNTEREHMTKALLDSEARYRQALDNMLEGCHIVGFDWRILYVNAAAAQQARLRLDSIVGRPVSEVLPGLERSELFSLYRRGLNERCELRVETAYVFPDGVRRWFLLTVLPVADGITVFTVDITDRKQAHYDIQALNASLERRVASRTSELVLAREAAESANLAKSAFLATMSHEIRTPMNGVIGMAEVLSNSEMPQHQADAVRTIRTSALSLLGIIDDILDFSKIEAGRLELERAPVDVHDLFESACETLVPIALDKNVELHLFVSPQVPSHLWSDSTRLRQLLFNLAGNAIKFSSRQRDRGQVSIRIHVTASDPPRLVMRVADNGIGMSADSLKNVFSPFTQAEASTTRRFGGTGLGLTICKRLVELMDGEIHVQSTLGEGSTFTVELPIEAVSGTAPLRSVGLAGQTCILIGCQDRAADLREYLGHAGAAVHEAADLSSALPWTQGVQRPVLIHDASGRKASMAAGPIETPLGVDARHVFIVRGSQRGVSVSDSGAVMVNGNCLRRSALLRAVSVALGREAPPALDLEAAPLADKRSKAPTIASARQQGRLLLIAEDDEVNQKVILLQVEMLGYAAELASNGADALRLWLQGRHALLLTDLNMPEMDGYALSQAIRRHEAVLNPQSPERMPILALSANVLREETVRAAAAGIDEFLTKPLPLHLLEQALAKWVPHAAADALPVSRPSQADEPSKPAAIDIQVLKDLIGDDPDVLRELTSNYMDAARTSALELREAHAAQDIRQVGAIAHRLTGSSRSVGALAFGDVCAELENACRAGARAGITEGIANFETALRDVQAHAF